MLAFNVSFIYPIYSCVNNNLILIKVEISAKNILKNSYSHLKLYFEVYINSSYMPFEFIHAEHNTRCETMVCIAVYKKHVLSVVSGFINNAPSC